MCIRRLLLCSSLLLSLSSVSVACKRDAVTSDDDDDRPKRRAKKHHVDEEESEAASREAEVKAKSEGEPESRAKPERKAEKSASSTNYYVVPPEAKVTERERARIERVANTHMGPMMKDPRMLAALAKVSVGLDPTTAYARGAAVGDRLARRGVARLPLEKLKLWSDARLRLANVSRPVCAGLWTGLSTQVQLNEAFAKLPEDDLDVFFKLLGEAVRLELDAGTDPLPNVGEGTFVRGLTQLRNKLDPELRAKFDNALTKATTASEEDACTATKVVHGHWRDIDESWRDKFLRSLAIAVAGGT
jgi:hypothetical protein